MHPVCLSAELLTMMLQTSSTVQLYGMQNHANAGCLLSCRQHAALLLFHPLAMQVTCLLRISRSGRSSRPLPQEPQQDSLAAGHTASTSIRRIAHNAAIAHRAYNRTLHSSQIKLSSVPLN